MRIHTAGKDGKHTACEGDRCRFDTDKIVDEMKPKMVKARMVTDFLRME